METLYISQARLRFRYGDLSYQTPSRFLDEIDPSLIETDTSVVFRPERKSAGGINSVKRRMVPRSEGKSRETPRYSDLDPRVDYTSDEEKTLTVGTLVEHEYFGRGKVVVINGKGETMKAVVNFESVGRKNLMVKFARLKLL